jgi:hypothetical protein
MLRSARRLDIARSWAIAKAEHAAVVSERDRLRRELERTRQSLAEVRAAARELQAASLARLKCEAELVELRREFAIRRAWAQERGNAPLN